MEILSETHAVKPGQLCECGDGWTFDFQSKTVYCQRCAVRSWVQRAAREITQHGHYIDPGTEKAAEWAAMLSKAAKFLDY